MPKYRRDSGVKRTGPPPQLPQQLRDCDGRSNIPRQYEIDAIYAAEYGEPTQQDRNDFLLLFLGLHQDIMELQQELLQITAEGADAMTIAPCFYGRLNVIMKERIETLASGTPLMVEGYPPTYPGRMMSRWAREYYITVPSLYERAEDLLAAQVQQSSPETTTTSDSTAASTCFSTTYVETDSATVVSRKRRKIRQRSRKAALSRSGK
ncbi:hypothetical protein ACET3X_002846 [Alternaria dauci]|uniref:Uncharacterized protein n=1 Tax=Alternaria dauci TaxID=48095 RepID=A0ABR3USL8_9PLEO